MEQTLHGGSSIYGKTGSILMHWYTCARLHDTVHPLRVVKGIVHNQHKQPVITNIIDLK